MKARNWNAVDAHFRRGGPMKHKNTPRGGARNNSRDLLSEQDDEAIHPAEISLMECEMSEDRDDAEKIAETPLQLTREQVIEQIRENDPALADQLEDRIEQMRKLMRMDGFEIGGFISREINALGIKLQECGDLDECKRHAEALLWLATVGAQKLINDGKVSLVTPGGFDA